MNCDAALLNDLFGQARVVQLKMPFRPTPAFDHARDARRPVDVPLDEMPAKFRYRS